MSGALIAVLPMLLGVGIGFALPLQTAINAQLRAVLSSPFRASLVSFLVGTAALWIILALNEGGIGLPDGFLQSEPWWIWLGGVFGVLFLTGNILMFPKLGGMQTVVMPILGQIIASNAIDAAGWFGVSRHPISVQRLLGIVLAFIGVALAVVIPDIRASRSRRMLNQSPDGAARSRWMWQILGVLLGMLGASQTAINGRLGSELGSALHASFISFLIGTLLLVLIVIIQEGFTHGRRADARPKQGQAASEPTPSATAAFMNRLAVIGASPWWFWIGGLIGATYVFGNAFLAPVLGTGLTVIIVLFGQICGGLTVDQFGLLRASKRRVTGIQIVGAAILLAGIIAIRLF